MQRIGRRASVRALLFVLALTSAARSQESWDAIYIKGEKIGHLHVWVEPIKQVSARTKDLVNVRVDWDMSFKRGDDRVQLKQHYGTIETKDGSVLRLDTRSQTADGDIRTYGDVDRAGKAMGLTIEVGKNKQMVEIPWSADVRGPYAAELSLSRDPMKPGLNREVKTYIPDLNKVCLTKLSAKDYEEIPLGPQREKKKLLRVEQVVTDAAGTPLPGMASTLWVDASGQIMKSYTDLLGGMETFRTTKAGATAANGTVGFDLLTESIIKTRTRIANSEKTRLVTYRVTMEKEDPTSIFPKDRRQAARAEGSKNVALIQVRTAGLNDGQPDIAAPSPDTLRANPLINSDDSNVIAHTREALQRAQNNDWAKAVAIEEWVSTNIRKKNFGVAFAAASEVALNLEGDCTEHSVLVAAMCRAAGIPTRCVVGIMYVEHLKGFGPHMWNEVYVNGRWVAIDATFRQSEVDATHLKLAETSLDGVAPFEVFLPVLKVFKGIQVEPIEMR